MIGRRRVAGTLALGCCLVGAAGVASGQAPGPITSMGDLARLTPGQLDALYLRSAPAAPPAGRVRGRALIAPGSALAGPISAGSRVMWQGKTFRAADSTAINRFFGVPIIRGRVYQGASWLDGRPSLILDYQGTSRLYANYRDEIRQVGPGLFLGLMYDRTTAPPDLRMYFAFQSKPQYP